MKSNWSDTLHKKSGKKERYFCHRHSRYDLFLAPTITLKFFLYLSPFFHAKTLFFSFLIAELKPEKNPSLMISRPMDLMTSETKVWNIYTIVQFSATTKNCLKMIAIECWICRKYLSRLKNLKKSLKPNHKKHSWLRQKKKHFDKKKNSFSVKKK